MLMFRSLAGDSRDQLGIVSDAVTTQRAKVASLRCERVHFSAGTGLCIARDTGLAAGYRARIFDADLRVRREAELEGIPSRARVSADGRMGAVTMFVTGHAYATAGSFSTQTTLMDLRAGRRVAELEDFTVSRAGRVLTAVDVNYWGVTFAPDGDRFYATLATGGQTYLVAGFDPRSQPSNRARERRVPLPFARRHSDRLQETRC